MKLHKFLLVFGLVGASLVFLTERVRARNGTVIAQQSVSDKRDGQHDFDFLVGSWKFHLKRLVRRLAGSNEWVEFDGTTVCRKVLDGRAEVEEMNVYSPDKQYISRVWRCVFTTPSPISGASTGPTRPMESWSRIPWSDSLATGEGNSITNKSMRVERSTHDSSGQTSQRIRHTSSRRFLPMGEKRGKRTG